MGHFPPSLERIKKIFKCKQFFPASNKESVDDDGVPKPKIIRSLKNDRMIYI